MSVVFNLLLGNEYSFSSSGVFHTPPRQAPGARFRESIDLGGPCPTASDVDCAIQELKSEFKGSDYHILNKNCNHFAGAISLTQLLCDLLTCQLILLKRLTEYQLISEALVRYLLGRSIPGYVNRLAGIGSFFSCLIPQSMLKDAPVDGQDSSSSSSSGGSSFTTGNNKRFATNNNSANEERQPFIGSGFKLGM